jgi:hypothetical protein
VRIFRFIAAKKTEHSIQIMCRVLEVSRSGYHAWAVREPLSSGGRRPGVDGADRGDPRAVALHVRVAAGARRAAAR